MKVFHIIICLLMISLLIWLNHAFVRANAVAYGGLTWIGWVSIVLVGFGIGFLVILNDSARAFGFFRERDKKAVPPRHVRTLDSAELAELGLENYDGPKYPHPVIFPNRCIGCQACVDACPHNVLDIVDGVAAAVDPEQCMEDTACQAECPVNPKACIVINTSKEVRSLPIPTRDGSTYQTNVPGCFIIGDVSGVPLIKNGVKEGAEVIANIVAELATAAEVSKAEYDVAIIGIGPAGASAAAEAQMANLRYVAIEQGKKFSTIDLFPKGKYIFFKPDTKGWFGGIPVAGLGLAMAEYGAGEFTDDDAVFEALGPEVNGIVNEQTQLVHKELIAKITVSLRQELSPLLFEKIEKELRKRIAGFLRSKESDGWTTLYWTHFLPDKDNLLFGFRSDIVNQLLTRIPGDQREKILDVWLSTLTDKGVKINEYESCKAVNRADDGDYFFIATERGDEKSPQTYTARRVIVSIGLRGAPNKLRLPNEDLKFKMDGSDRQKVLYNLSNPADFCGCRIVVVGGGNAAVEAAVDLVVIRDGAAIKPRTPEQMNKVTMLVRDFLDPTVKFANKFQLYQCVDDGLIDLRLGIGIREMREQELVLENVGTKQEVGTIPNDYIFALIGGERPNRFLESIGITINPVPRSN